MLKCDFAHAGCTAEVQRAKMLEHKQQNMEAHLTMCSHTIEQQATVLQQQSSAMRTLQQQMKQIITNLKPEALARATFIPPPSFVVKDFTRRRSSANSVYSSLPFYSHIQGYKLALGVVVNGWGVGKGSHVSVFLFLLRGEYDNNLSWPFQADIKLQLVNQMQDSLHKEVTISTLNESDAAGRVRNKNAACLKEFPMFISHDALFDEHENIQYLKHDSLEFRVVNIELKTSHALTW